jgi:hypothetical protein
MKLFGEFMRHAAPLQEGEGRGREGGREGGRETRVV